MATTVLGRALSVLACFNETSPALTLSQLSRMAGLPLTTTHRLVGELLTWGALERDEDGRLTVGLRIWELGALAARHVGLREAALPYLEDLYEVTHENVQVAIRDGHEAVYVERISGRNAVHVVTRPGSRLPLHATAVGLVLLAWSDVEVVDSVLGRPLEALTPRTLTNPAALRRELSAVRRAGYAVSDRAVEDISVAVAAPVYDYSQRVVAALSVVVSSRRGRANQYVPAVLAAARGVSRSLGAVR